MKIKNFILKIVNLPKLIKRLWIILWLSLFILVAMKLCFNVWYPIIVENDFIINICNFIDDNKIIKILLYLVFYILNCNIIFLTSTIQKKYNNKLLAIILNVIFVIVYLIKFTYNTIGSILEIITIIILPIIYNVLSKKINIKISILLPIIIYILLNLWQLNILFVRNINNILTDIPTLISLILQIDYYIFLLITWIGVSYMGAWGIGWLWGKTETELLALKEEELKKEKPDEKLIEQIDKKLEELKYETSD